MTSSTSTSSERSSAPTAASAPARLLIGLVRGYQRLRAGRVAPCRFYPSCSQYALEALEVHGARHGTVLALRRLGRCRPFGPHGIDLVPLPRDERSA
jgi:putative membrane protein insertion efficiency factor